MAKLKIGFIADPISKFDPHNETTSFLIHEFLKRGWPCYHFALSDLILKDGTPYAEMTEVKTKLKKSGFEYQLIKTELKRVDSLQALFLRKDPPFDLNFLDHLSILELVNSKKTLLINNPTWIKHANEKLYPLHFDGISPKSLVSQKNSLLKEFVKKQKTAILKPLNLSGGRGIIKVEHSNPSLSSIIDVLTQDGDRYILAQEYLPAALKGDKRILILDGEPLGAFLRVPSKKDFRGNLHSGANLKACRITAKDKTHLEKICPKLKELGLYFVGLDVIGDYVTEINCTSPMGIGEINQLQNIKSESLVADWLESKL